MREKQALVQKVEAYIQQQFTNGLPEGMVYHSLQHTRLVVHAVQEIGSAEALNKHELTLAVIAAWFHDVGYIFNPNDHENTSALLSTSFLREQGVNAKDIQRVKDAIVATRLPQKPKDKLSKVLCDADMYHLSSENYPQLAHLLYQELKQFRKMKLSEDDFDLLSVDFFLSHAYFTTYGINVLTAKKEKNLALLKQRIESKQVNH
jgi:predicted metal-dependent HD superfamily phosphohydrolase